MFAQDNGRFVLGPPREGRLTHTCFLLSENIGRGFTKNLQFEAIKKLLINRTVLHQLILTYNYIITGKYTMTLYCVTASVIFDLSMSL